VTTIVWLRNDLRLADNPALADAAARGPVVPVYVWSPDEEGDWPPGAA
jgi:deoxyribodipyrimidine photo-lyase